MAVPTSAVRFGSREIEQQYLGMVDAFELHRAFVRDGRTVAHGERATVHLYYFVPTPR